MQPINSFIFPDLPPEFCEILSKDENKSIIIVGVIGKSDSPDCNKMAGLKILKNHVSMTNHVCKEGQITFYFAKDSNIIYIHFETPFDTHIMLQMLDKTMDRDTPLDHFVSFNSHLRTKFAKSLLFAIHMCHIIVMVEPTNVFDSTYLSIFKCLKIVREKYVIKFLPKLLKNSNTGSFLGKEGRLCSPRFIFLFEQPFEWVPGDDELKQLEYDVEDDIYKMLRNEFIITNNSAMSLFSIPRNQKFVYINDDVKIRSNPLRDSLNLLNTYIENPLIRDEDKKDLYSELRPFKGFAVPWNLDTKKDDILIDPKKERSFHNLIKDHVNEAFEYGFDDSMSKYRGKSHFVIPTFKSWYETFKILHKLFIENLNNPNFEANDPDYKAFFENFHNMMDTDEKFFNETCEHGLECAIINYNDLLPHHFSKSYHEQKLTQAIGVFQKYARGPEIPRYEAKLKDYCDSTWLNGKQQCEFPSLRGNPCIMPKHSTANPSEHSSGVVFVSSCNCGKIQGHREDPYTIKQSNYEFYKILANNCVNCNKLEKITFPIFEPSINDFKAAELLNNKNLSSLLTEMSIKTPDVSEHSEELSARSQDSNINLSLESMDDLDKIKNASSDESVNEFVITVGDVDIKEKSIIKQISTTEYLPGMLHTASPSGLLPQFQSWSLVCIGPSSIYSHNTGLPEHCQSGFLSGANYLLPWDVHVRLEHAHDWAASYEKNRQRKKGGHSSGNSGNGNYFNLKIFVGTEYECPRGHRFFMSSPTEMVRGGSGIVRDSGSKIVFNDMPLYFPCPCRTSKPPVAQLMRVHVVTPKAPVDVILDPKVRPGNRTNLTFVTGLSEPAKLSQSAYWILRLPYIYQNDDGPMLQPTEVTPSTALLFGCLLSGMYGVKESETIP